LSLEHHASLSQFQKAHREWVEAALRGDIAGPDHRWSESIAVGSEKFVEQVKNELGALEHNIGRRTICILFESRRLTATISIGKMRL
jgi:hypothetical protein